ncbi:MAG: diadenylate cyclase CdaA [Clostridia bacterium]|nr:diadenylate cyclase CdaA [Clostridia bacterium]
MMALLKIDVSGFNNFFHRVVEIFKKFNVSDAVDIFLLTCVFIIAFRFLKTRKAGALIVGIVVCAIVWGISRVFHLEGLHFILSGVFNYGILALVIIFQPEIRDALEKLGSGSIGKFSTIGDKNKKLYYSVIDNICNAVADLSATKTGALIVIERATQVDDIIETGIKINADVNSSLLRNIFFNRAPLHDGAVVIEEGRISAAGCLLPLTRRTDVDSNLGTRHRAAIGMSESSDAVIIVVSEETGVISVAFDCTLTRNYTSASLRRFLTKKLIRTGEESEEA